MRKLVILGLGSVLFGGCYYTETLIGVLSYDGTSGTSFEDDFVVVPDSVSGGSIFTAIVYTDGGDCIIFNSTRVDIDIERNVATITPYDTYKTPRWLSSGCDAFRTIIAHKATIRFRKKGQATVFFRVRDRKSDRDSQLLSRIVHVY